MSCSEEYRIESECLKLHIVTEKCIKFWMRGQYIEGHLYSDFFKSKFKKLLIEIDIFKIIGDDESKEEFENTIFRDKDDLIYENNYYISLYYYIIDRNIHKIISYIYNNNLDNYLEIISILRTLYIYYSARHSYYKSISKSLLNNNILKLVFYYYNIDIFVNLHDSYLNKRNEIKIKFLSGEILLSFSLEIIKSLFDILLYLSILYKKFNLVIDGNYYCQLSNVSKKADTSIPIEDININNIYIVL